MSTPFFDMHAKRFYKITRKMAILMLYNIMHWHVKEWG
jgi:hypothetical protein